MHKFNNNAGHKSKISSRRQVEEELLRSEKRFRAVAYSVSDMIWERDIRDDSLRWFGNIDDALGYEEGEFPRTISGLMDHIHPDDLEHVKRNAEIAVLSGESFLVEYRIRCKDGSYRYLAERAAAIGFEAGKAVKWAGAISDVTDRLQAEQTLRESESRFKRLSHEFHTLLDAMPDHLLLLTRDLKVVWLNRAAAEGKQIDRDRISPDIMCYEMCCNLDSPCDNCPVVECFVSGREEHSVISNSEGRHWDIRAFPVKSGGDDVLNVIEVARDITERVRMEKEADIMKAKMIHADKMASLGTLVSGMAHEINNPNSFIMSNAELFTEIWRSITPVLSDYYRENKDFSPGGLEYSEYMHLMPKLLDGIHEGTKRIRDIVGNLQEFARPDTSGTNCTLDVNSVVVSAQSILLPTIKRHSDNFQVHLGNDLPAVRGNFQQIEQVVINLVLNALQSVTGRNGLIHVSTAAEREAGSVMVTVTDEGQGIPADVLDRVTEPFYTTRVDKGGRGLGLSVSYAIIKAHGGSLEIESKEGEGTAAYIRLPVCSDA